VKSISSIKFAAAASVVSFIVIFSSLANAQQDPDIAYYCVNDQRVFHIVVITDFVPPGYTVNWTVWVDQNPDVVGLSLSATGPYSSSITVTNNNQQFWSGL
jgi:hypothetical protein